MAKLKDEHKLYIAQQLGCYRSPAQIITALKDIYNAEASPQQIYNYQKQIANEGEVNAPTKKLQEAFYFARQQFEDNLVKIGVSFQPYRLQVLQDLLNKELSKAPRLQNDKKIMEILEMAAKEMGGIFTNRRDITSNGKSLATAESIAKSVFNDLIVEEGLSAKESAEFVTSRYKVEESVLISNANN